MALYTPMVSAAQHVHGKGLCARSAGRVAVGGECRARARVGGALGLCVFGCCWQKHGACPEGGGSTHTAKEIKKCGDGWGENNGTQVGAQRCTQQ